MQTATIVIVFLALAYGIAVGIHTAIRSKKGTMTMGLFNVEMFVLWVAIATVGFINENGWWARRLLQYKPSWHAETMRSALMRGIHCGP